MSSIIYKIIYFFINFLLNYLIFLLYKYIYNNENHYILTKNAKSNKCNKSIDTPCSLPIEFLIFVKNKEGCLNS